jgi:hypothetical protein
MWRAYAATADEARELAARLLEVREGPIEWSVWPMVAVWCEAGQ